MIERELAAEPMQRGFLFRERAMLKSALERLEQSLLSAAFGREIAWRNRVDIELCEVTIVLEQVYRVAGPADDLHHELADTNEELEQDVLQLQREVDYLPRWLQWFQKGIQSTSADNAGVRVVRDEGMRIVAAIKRIRAVEADLAFAALGIELDEYESTSL